MLQLPADSEQDTSPTSSNGGAPTSSGDKGEDVVFLCEVQVRRSRSTRELLVGLGWPTFPPQGEPPSGSARCTMTPVVKTELPSPPPEQEALRTVETEGPRTFGLSGPFGGAKPPSPPPEQDEGPLVGKGGPPVPPAASAATATPALPKEELPMDTSPEAQPAFAACQR